MTKLTYPSAATSAQIDDFHGTPVADPFRWLEETDAPATKAWIKAQNGVTFDFLAQIATREPIRQRLTELWDFPKRWAPVPKGGHIFQLRNTGLQNQDVLFVMDSPTDEGRILLDPNTLSEDGTVALSRWSVSENGRYLAYATSASGSDWLTWRVRGVETGADLADQIEWSKFSRASWAGDSSGFYYARYDAPAAGQDYLSVNYFQKIYFHRLGTQQAEDTLIYARPDQKEWGLDAHVSEDGDYLLIHVWQGTDVRNRFFFQKLGADAKVVELIPDLEAAYTFVGNDGPVFYLFTNLDAPKGRLIAIDTANPARRNWRTLIPEGEDALEQVSLVHNEFVTLTLHHAHHRLTRYDLAGQPLGEIGLPGLGSIPANGDTLNLTGQRTGKELFYAFWSFLHPVSLYRFDFQTGQSELLFAPDLPFDTSDYETRQLFAPSPDGTQVPLFLTHRRGMALDGQNPTLLYGYGGFNISLTPSFAVGRLVWLEMGGVWASANLRGGGEYGEAWHQAGMKRNKQNVFDDFIACAEFLIAEKITQPGKLGMMGGSNGGLLVGACMTQRPDLFGAAIPAVGVMDMLRFHKFTIGWAWVSDYGSAENPEEFPTLLAYSPLHNLKPGTAYPATLITTGDHDDRVVPGHSFKFAAALQAAQTGDAPTLIRIQTKAGHGAGKPTAILIQEAADIWAFLSHALEMG
ncbi:MAG: S9 family peptidase [Caldilineaceae bacterium]|nr:S9 family peptidase [Caldilineaceae bacterium]MBP8108235.1 S9 family peptidase [Caldilineaceae bacterium]MBP8124106.1 S9 family peptidase [Caldilineaceae bacterium]MBP9070931.1 S9 family peptidase [Caldilineaceae bacterium]